MDIYEQAIRRFSGISGVNAWKEMQTLFQRIATARPYHWSLPVQACEAVGGTPEQAIPAVAAVGCSHISIILVDDMLDSDPRGEYRRIGAPAAANLACAFQAAGLEMIVHSERKPAILSTALASFNKMYLVTALGQYWDVQCPGDEDAYWRMVQAKSSPFFSVALKIGALLGGASNEATGKLEEIGRLYGEMIQIHDDLSDTMVIPAGPDWLQGRSPLPILFAQTVDHPERSRFLELRRDVADEGALCEAQEILIRCGAVSYCMHQLLHRYQAARETLQTAELARPESIENLLKEVVAPVWKLFEEIGETHSQTPIP
ncbi:MAG: polyprenyl synthetase family protein [Chloroflexi bacterium]|nr:polyprenyl synthetase family protein [Chloroflexota bacterium]